MSEKMNWLCEYVSNTAVCDICGKQESGLPQYICDAHTHGMNLYGHREFQVIIDCGPQEICRLLNTMGMKVRDGEGFKPGIGSKICILIVRLNCGKNWMWTECLFCG